MGRIIPIVFALTLLADASMAQDETVINMPPPPQKQENGDSKAAVRKTNPERHALAHYARARTRTYNNYSSGVGYGYYGPSQCYGGHYHPYHSSPFGYHYGYPFTGYYVGYTRGEMRGGRPFFW